MDVAGGILGVKELTRNSRTCLAGEDSLLAMPCRRSFVAMGAWRDFATVAGEVVCNGCRPCNLSI